MLKRKLKNNNIKINLVSMMMDYEINVQRAAVTIWPELEIHGCFFHFSCLFYKRVRIRGMQERYNADVDFRSFVKSAVGIAHIPKEDIEAAVEVLRRFKFDDDEVLEFQEYLVNYIEDYWINGVFPPRVWSAWDRDDATNNNSEGSYLSTLDYHQHHHNYL